MSCVFYSRFVKYLLCDNELDPMEPVWRAAAGGMAGICATSLTYPLDVIRAKQTVEATSQTLHPASSKILFRAKVPEHFSRDAVDVVCCYHEKAQMASYDVE